MPTLCMQESALPNGKHSDPPMDSTATEVTRMGTVHLPAVVVDEQLKVIRKHIELFGESLAGVLRVQSEQIYNEVEMQMRNDLVGPRESVFHSRHSQDSALSVLSTASSPRPSSKRQRSNTKVFLEKARIASGTVESTPLAWKDKRKEGSISRKQCFVDEARLKAHVRDALYKQPYNVFDFYWETGIFQRIAKSSWFDTTTLTIIALNALWIAIDTDNNDAEVLMHADPIFQVGEHFFCAYFFSEWLVRFLAFERKRWCLRDGWFVFDSLLVFVMVMETWVMTIMLVALATRTENLGLGNTSVLRLFRLLRLTRMARILRLLRLFPELLILIKGISIAFRSVFFTLALLVGVVYLFAVGFTQLSPFGSKTKELFPTVTQSMLCLFLRGAFPDQAEMVEEIMAENVLIASFMVLYLLIGAITIMNMLVGILVEVVSVVSTVEKEQLSVYYVRQQLSLLCAVHDINIDPDDSEGIKREQFLDLIEDPHTASIIDETGADPVNVIDFLTFLYKTREYVSFPTFVEVILNLRPTNASTVKDVADVRKLVVSEVVFHLSEMEDRLSVSLEGMYQDLMMQCSLMNSLSLTKSKDAHQSDADNGMVVKAQIARPSPHKHRLPF
eukprot:TRINITY_DN5456_c0_g4_i2.p1 TRINITY_DN5456_c0_g4~~TRINITY_DN5456_c0_g4_i2.p1  ORF type:complete len:616 (-),score=106.59 TRINITY_DN5456_c0_g4_i2:30-1877(-)